MKSTGTSPCTMPLESYALTRGQASCRCLWSWKRPLLEKNWYEECRIIMSTIKSNHLDVHANMGETIGFNLIVVVTPLHFKWVSTHELSYCKCILSSKTIESRQSICTSVVQSALCECKNDSNERESLSREQWFWLIVEGIAIWSRVSKVTLSSRELVLQGVRVG